MTLVTELSRSTASSRADSEVDAAQALPDLDADTVNRSSTPSTEPHKEIVEEIVRLETEMDALLDQVSNSAGIRVTEAYVVGPLVGRY